MKNYFSLDEVIKASIEEAFMNARDMFPVAVVKDDICKKIMDHSLAPKSVSVRKKKKQEQDIKGYSTISKPITCYLLVKIGRKEHMERLLKNGEVYMNSTKFFRDHKNAEIGDTYEGALYIENGRVAKYRKKISKEKLYCMWNINSLLPLHQDIVHSIVYDETTGKRTVNLDFRELSGFTPGEDTYMVVIRDVKEFNERFYRACKKAKADFVKHSVVTYYDEYTINPNKRLSPFHKRKRYEKQQEIRYLAYKDTNKALILKLGSLEDIAGIYNVNEFCLVIDDCKIRA